MEWNWEGALKGGAVGLGEGYAAVMAGRADETRQARIDQAKMERENTQTKWKAKQQRILDKQYAAEDQAQEQSPEQKAYRQAQLDEKIAAQGQIDKAGNQTQTEISDERIAKQTARINANPNYTDQKKKELVAALHGDKMGGTRKELTPDFKLKLEVQAEEKADALAEPGSKEHAELKAGFYKEGIDKFEGRTSSGFKPTIPGKNEGENPPRGQKEAPPLSDAGVTKIVGQLAAIRDPNERAREWQDLADNLSPAELNRIKAAVGGSEGFLAEQEAAKNPEGKTGFWEDKLYGPGGKQ